MGEDGADLLGELAVEGGGLFGVVDVEAADDGSAGALPEFFADAGAES